MSDLHNVTEGPANIKVETSTMQLSQITSVPVGQNLPGVVMIEHSYVRIQKRIMEETGKQNPSTWIAGAFASFGIGVSSFLGVLAIPGKAHGLYSGTRPIMVVIGIASFLMGGVCLIAKRSVSRDAKEVAKSICEEMDAWANRT